MTPLNIRQHSGVRSPTMSRLPNRNSTDDTKTAFTGGAGTPAARRVLTISSRRDGTNNFPLPDRAKRIPTDRRAIVIPIHSYCCKALSHHGQCLIFAVLCPRNPCVLPTMTPVGIEARHLVRKLLDDRVDRRTPLDAIFRYESLGDTFV